MSLLRDVIAGQRDDVGLQPVGSLDRALDLFAAGKRTVMNVRKLHDAKTVEGFRQTV